MNIFRKTYLATILLILVFLSASAKRRTEVPLSYQDSLEYVLHRIDTPIKKLPVLMTLANLNWLQSKEVGLMRAYQSLGYIYQKIGRNKDAVVTYRKGLV